MTLLVEKLCPRICERFVDGMARTRISSTRQAAQIHLLGPSHFLLLHDAHLTVEVKGIFGDDPTQKIGINFIDTTAANSGGTMHNLSIK